MAKNVTPYKTSTKGKKNQVEQMFDNISGNYDRLNKVISFGMDIKWRKNVLQITKDKKPDSILDIATGTGDMLLLFAKTSAKKIVGLDISKGMLEQAKIKMEQHDLQDIVELQVGDAENLNFDDHSFDVVTITFGIRNFETLEKGMAEILRVLKPNGLCVILETSIPSNPIMKMGYMVYTKTILPLIGRIFSTDKKAYAYLSESAIAFPYGEKLKSILEVVGFKNVEVDPQSGGISTIYKAFK